MFRIKVRASVTRVAPKNLKYEFAAKKDVDTSRILS